ncbi:hypothetical protein MRX96_009977 [Rhipicephalus microplus]
MNEENDPVAVPSDRPRRSNRSKRAGGDGAGSPQLPTEQRLAKDRMEVRGLATRSKRGQDITDKSPFVEQKGHPDTPTDASKAEESKSQRKNVRKLNAKPSGNAKKVGAQTNAR